MKRSIGGAFALAMLLASGPAGADVKAGVDAWGRGDFAGAVAEWRPLAIQGDADAQFNLGQAYKLGRGVPIDLAQAQLWFKRAADQGHFQAEDNYGLGLYQMGRRAEAVPWLERSIARGEPRTQLVLGTMLFNGDGVKADHARAYTLMTRAAQAGLPSASQSLAQMEGFLSAGERQRGLQLAQGYAAQPHPVDAGPAAAPSRPDRTPSPAPVRTAHLPSSTALEPRDRPAPRRTSAPPMVPPAVATHADRWRVQLGAFRDRANAEALWSRVGGRIGGGARPAYVAGNGVTRLQATGFATRADARRACTAAGGGCLVIGPRS
jgi:hypothetical protein